jgi:hypothetical protein
MLWDAIKKLWDATNEPASFADVMSGCVYRLFCFRDMFPGGHIWKMFRSHLPIRGQRVSS